MVARQVKNSPLRILVLASLFLLCSGWAGSGAYAQKQSESAIHEMPEADRCSVVIMHIRELAASLQQVAREISLLKQTARSAFKSNSREEPQMNQHDQKFAALKEKESSLRQQMYMREQQLKNCLRQDSPPKQ
jgi:hypothetical protein